MFVNGAHARADDDGDFAVAFSLGNPVEYFGFPRRQSCEMERGARKRWLPLQRIWDGHTLGMHMGEVEPARTPCGVDGAVCFLTQPRRPSWRRIHILQYPSRSSALQAS